MPNDIRLSVDFFASRKTKRLRRRKGADYVLALQQVWILAARSYPDGVFTDLSADDIADEIDWPNDPDDLMEALVTAGFVDLGDDGTYSVHDWDEWQPWVSAAPARQRASRKAIHERWANKGACKGGTEFCDKRCVKVEETKKTKPKKNRDIYATYTKRIRNVKIRNTPIPIPSPIPSPPPPPEVLEPDVEVPATAEQSVGMDGIDFSEETVTAPEQPSEPHSEPTPAEELPQVEETPQEPEEATTEATARAMVAALGVTIPAEPIEDDDHEQSHNGCSVVERNWAVGRDLDDLPDHEALTTLDVDKALRGAGHIRGATSTHAWGKLGKLHEASPLTAGELRSALRLAQGPKVGAHLPYMAGCVERRRQGLVTPPSTRPQSPTSVTVPRKVEAIHEETRRKVEAFLELQKSTGYPRDLQRARKEALSGMPTEGDVERYRRNGGDYARMDAEEEAVSTNGLRMLGRSIYGERYAESR